MSRPSWRDVRGRCSATTDDLQTDTQHGVAITWTQSPPVLSWGVSEIDPDRPMNLKGRSDLFLSLPFPFPLLPHVSSLSFSPSLPRFPFIILPLPFLRFSFPPSYSLTSHHSLLSSLSSPKIMDLEYHCSLLTSCNATHY